MTIIEELPLLDQEAGTYAGKLTEYESFLSQIVLFEANVKKVLVEIETEYAQLDKSEKVKVYNELHKIGKKIKVLNATIGNLMYMSDDIKHDMVAIAAKVLYLKKTLLSDIESNLTNIAVASTQSYVVNAQHSSK